MQILIPISEDNSEACVADTPGLLEAHQGDGFYVGRLLFYNCIINRAVFHAGGAGVTFLRINLIPATNIIDRLILTEWLARSTFNTFFGDDQLIHKLTLSPPITNNPNPLESSLAH